jgi:hypothetical protein
MVLKSQDMYDLKWVQYENRLHEFQQELSVVYTLLLPIILLKWVETW